MHCMGENSIKEFNTPQHITYFGEIPNQLDKNPLWTIFYMGEIPH